MPLLRAAFAYFLWIFSAGFALALVRLPFLVPALGVRAAELMEMPVMLGVITWAARRLVRRHPGWSRRARLGAGGVALLVLGMAELALAYTLDGRSPAAYVASRDPVSGSVYLAALLYLAVAPAAWPARADHRTNHRADAPADDRPAA